MIGAPGRQLVIDRTIALCGAGGEWGVHIAAFAGKAGLDATQVRSLAGGSPADGCWSPADLVAAVGDDGALDLLLACGWCHAISFTVRALRLPLEPGTERPDSP
ncbi:hypothetical protein Amsp01_070780 [Amycolatopsis sp. NBRC 101858]|uniref:hypothetical protein n=1 Tax=Amycolatopsis sp. NBRC 101858 TaxID=3032200 RepID=UPI0024A3BFE4|nr:hypothetical protein [Amycolatopsis sp. NBRC 101858]GLY41055.1 hypothetical protein Amsp01_070780 [Amycolatopsis sp. NBRC 101858]